MQIQTRSPDHKFTQQYSQPQEYHFCWDSVIFARFVADRLRRQKDLAGLRALDLCAGCGVIGFEIAHHLPALSNMDFVEIQNVYRPHFEKNAAIAGRRDFRFREMNYEGLLSPEFAGAYDLIVCNPPYFFAEDGKIGPNEVKNRSRFFIDSSFEVLIRAIASALTARGQAFVLAKPGARHGRDSLRTIQDLVSEFGLRAQKTAAIRGTDVILINSSLSTNIDY